MTESTRSKYTDHNIEKSNTHHPYCLICGTDIKNHPTETFPTDDEIQFDEIPKESEIHPMRKPLIEILANQNKFWTSHIEHSHCENCHTNPYQILYISSNFTPLHLCLQCGIKFDSLLNA